MPGFTIFALPRFRKLARALRKKHPEFALVYAKALTVLRSDPYNRSHRHKIKKLSDVTKDGGQYRLKVRRFRFRYDILGNEVVLKYCGIRREDTYK